MEFVVVDDGSDREDPEPVLQAVGRGRISLRRNGRNLGISGNFNRCIELARGEWVHLLHADDEVCPGLYQEARRIAEQFQPDVMVFRSQYMDERGNSLDATPDLSGLAGSPGLRRVMLGYGKVQCVGVIVRRRACEQVGGFREDLRYLLDVEMWSRLFFACRTHFSPLILTKYRLHGESDGGRQRNSGAPAAEFYDLAALLRENMKLTPEEMRWYRRFCHRAVNDICRELATARNWTMWKRCAAIYARHLEGPREWFDFIARNLRNTRRFCFGARPKTDPGHPTPQENIADRPANEDYAAWTTTNAPNQSAATPSSPSPHAGGAGERVQERGYS